MFFKILIFTFLCFPIIISAQTPDQKNLPIDLAPSEKFDSRFVAKTTNPPEGPIHALGEWEKSDYAMVLWVNKSLISNLAKRTKVKLLADTQSDVTWWKNWLQENNISEENISFFVVPTNSIWVRDYGPWYILDGRGNLGMVDTKYNRPRPQDNMVPEFISKMTNVPFYRPGLAHTGGNFYSDGLGEGFSSTLVYTENSFLSKKEIDERMHDYLGIKNYITSRLAPGITIEHFDTFGKIVAPDTIVFSDFPEGSRYRKDSEAMVAKLKQLKTPYGTSYKIHRMKMIKRQSDNDYRAYINSFINNGVLYYPIYGNNDEDDLRAKKVYQSALPGYEIVGVDGLDTNWGDSVHCRTRNIMTRDAIFVFPKVPKSVAILQDIEISANIFPSPGAFLKGKPKLHYRVNKSAFQTIEMSLTKNNVYSCSIPGQRQGSLVSLFIEVEDTNNNSKTAPIGAPNMTIDIEIK